jgi:uncharacterized protein (DUF1330 family)
MSPTSFDGLDITPDALRALLDAGDGPVTLVNFVRLRPDGAVAYQRYLDAVAPAIARIDAELIYSGSYVSTLIGDERWDHAAVTRYADRRELAKLLADPEFEAATPLRHAALEAGVLHAFA